VQGRAAKFANNADQTGWESLEEKRKLSRLCVLFKRYTGRRAWEAIGDRHLRPCYQSREDNESLWGVGYMDVVEALLPYKNATNVFLQISKSCFMLQNIN
jgi:hypothetical protein